MTFLFTSLDPSMNLISFKDNIKLDHTINILQKTTQIFKKGLYQGELDTKCYIV